MTRFSEDCLPGDMTEDMFKDITYSQFNAILNQMEHLAHDIMAKERMVCSGDGAGDYHCRKCLVSAKCNWYWDTQCCDKIIRCSLARKMKGLGKLSKESRNG